MLRRHICRMRNIPGLAKRRKLNFISFMTTGTTRHFLPFLSLPLEFIGGGGGAEWGGGITVSCAEGNRRWK